VGGKAMRHLKFAKEYLWQERNWVGKILFSVLWPLALVAIIVDCGFDWLEEATKKK
jgi:hypothetical protein